MGSVQGGLISQSPRTILYLAFMLFLVIAPAFAQHRGGGGVARQCNSYRAAPVYSGAGWYGGYGGYSGYGNYGYSPSYGGPLNVMPNYWWVGPYPSENPCQAGCNPNAGYEWDSVGTLILDTNPPKARVSLDGIYAGTTDKLGPFQLPVGQHTLHIEAPGFEPSDIIVKFDEPGVQNLNVELKRLTASAKPAPRG
jgi:hypothetical protein